MPSPDLIRLYADSDALTLADLVRTGQVTPGELAEAAIAVIERLDPALNAVPIRTYDLGRAQAAGPGTGPFAGVPFLLKDIGTEVAGVPLTWGWGWRRGYVSSADSEMGRRFKAAGLVMLGRTNVPENGWCIATEPPAYGPTVNPWNAAVTPGGSSGGAGAAVAARMVPIAEGSDGGGSIRVPASCCGVVGLKPSRGRVSYGPEAVDIWFGGVYTLALTRTVRDTAAVLDAVAGTLPGDPYTPPTPARSWLDGLAAAPRRLRIGATLTTPWGPPFAPEVAEAVRATMALLEQLGHEVEEHPFATPLEESWFHYNQVHAVQTAVDQAGLEARLGRRAGEADMLPLNWALLQRGRALSATEYQASIAAVRRGNQRVQAELHPYDVFLTPTLTQPPRPVGYWDMNEPDFDRYNATWTDAAFMFAFNMSGLPAMSVPATWTAQDVPIGVQLVGRYGDEAAILGVAAQLEHARPWIGRRPAVCA